MRTAQTINRSIFTLALLGCLVLINLIGLRFFSRLDLTRDRQFTLSPATLSTLNELEDPVTVRAYFTKDLPPPFSTQGRYVHDLLEEYYTNSGGKLVYEFIDPTGAETDEDKDKKKDTKRDVFGRLVREQTSIERELATLGIAPVQVQVNEGDKLEVKRAYLGIAVGYRGENEVIPVVQGTTGLEYDLTTLIRKLTRKKRAKIGIVTGHKSPDPQKKIGRMSGLLTQLYDVVPVDLAQEEKIADDIDAVLVIGPHEAIPEAELRKLDAFLTSGRSAAFFVDAVDVNLEELKTEDVDHGLAPMLKSYGVELKPGLVLDTECTTLSVSRQQGFMRIQQPVRYPFIPEPRTLDPNDPLTRGLSGAVFPFMSPVEAGKAGAVGVDANVLVQSSEKSWVDQPPYDLNPFQRWTTDQVADQGKHDLLVALSGKIPSHFDPNAPVGDGSRLVVAGGASFVHDDFFSEGNQALFLNLMDWLVRDDALLAVRTRGMEAAPLEDVGESSRSMLKYANIVGIPLVCIAFGLVRWRRRESRRGRVTI
jgi:gliding-associated putative ABC transporter substrate-binding component GldG